jgi:hypothetical protein
MPIVGVERGAVLLEANPAVKDERDEALARFDPERRGRVEAASDLRRVDAEQAHAADGRDVDGVAVDDGADKQRVGADGGDRG